MGISPSLIRFGSAHGLCEMRGGQEFNKLQISEPQEACGLA